MWSISSYFRPFRSPDSSLRYRGMVSSCSRMAKRRPPTTKSACIQALPRCRSVHAKIKPGCFSQTQVLVGFTGRRQKKMLEDNDGCETMRRSADGWARTGELAKAKTTVQIESVRSCRKESDSPRLCLIGHGSSISQSPTCACTKSHETQNPDHFMPRVCASDLAQMLRQFCMMAEEGKRSMEWLISSLIRVGARVAYHGGSAVVCSRGISHPMGSALPSCPRVIAAARKTVDGVKVGAVPSETG